MHCSLRKHMQIDRNTSTLKKIPSLLLTADFNDSPTASTTSAHTDQSVRTCTPSYSANCWGQNWQRVWLQQNAEWPMRQKHWWKQRGAAYRERERESGKDGEKELREVCSEEGGGEGQSFIIISQGCRLRRLDYTFSSLSCKKKTKKNTHPSKNTALSACFSTQPDLTICVCVCFCVRMRGISV